MFSGVFFIKMLKIIYTVNVIQDIKIIIGYGFVLYNITSQYQREI